MVVANSDKGELQTRHTADEHFTYFGIMIISQEVFIESAVKIFLILRRNDESSPGWPAPASHLYQGQPSVRRHQCYRRPFSRKTEK